MERTVTLHVKRSGGSPEPAPSWQRFPVPWSEEQMSVLDALLWVQRNADLSLAFRCACRVGMCGTCGMVINGREGLACRTLLRRIARGGEPEVRLEPMRHLPVVKDLATDMDPFFARYRKVVPHLVPRDGDGAPATIPPTARERRLIDPQRECIACGLCYSACDVAGMEGGFLGPAALNRAFVLTMDSRDAAAQRRLNVVAGEDGLWRCHTLFECAAVCPKGISPALAIQGLKRKVVGQRLKRLVRLGR